MSLELCILASGSSGNCTVLRAPTGTMLIDAGLGPRITAQRLNGTGVHLDDITAICLTHLDSDHFRVTWAPTIAKRGIRVYCHHTHAARIGALVAEFIKDPECERQFGQKVVPFDGVFEPLESLTVNTTCLAHDNKGSHAFVFNGFGCRVGWATDLGTVPGDLLEIFCDLDVLALESNYDPTMQVESSRPIYLKHRIMGGAGHLSNEQAFEAIRALLNRCEKRGTKLPSHIVLLHRSRQCNCPKIVREMFNKDARVAPRLVLAEQYARSEWIRPRPMKPLAGEQLILGWG